MSKQAPHFLLYSDVGPLDGDELRGWRFELRASDGSQCLEASDYERNMSKSRLELLSVIRGLEALDQPSRVTLVTSSRYVGSGLHHGLEQWRLTDYQWDDFGVMTPIKNEDLWRRLDHTLDYHQLECRVRRGSNVPPDLATRFRVERSTATEPQRCDEEVQVAATHSAKRTAPTPYRPTKVDRHWPRRKKSWHRIAAAIGSAAAATAAIVAVKT